MEFVKRYDWPGNVRQLYNALLQAAVMTDSEVIDRHDVTAAIGGMACEPTLKPAGTPDR